MMVALPPPTDHGLARWLAWQAGQRLVTLRAELGHTDQQRLRDAGDRCSHEFIVGELARWRPSDAVLSEEGEDNPARLKAERVWIVDPLDGTREFGEPGRADWAVHVGLWAHGKLVAGAVGLPARARVLATDSPPSYPPINGSGCLRVAVSRTRPPALLATMSPALGEVIVVPMGSAGAKIAAVIDGEVDAYIHVGILHEWDSAAPVAVALATGLHVSRINGAIMPYNQCDPTTTDLVVCRKDLAPRLIDAMMS